MIKLPVFGNSVDVDVYASVLAYMELLNRNGRIAEAEFFSLPNYSVPSELRIFDLEKPADTTASKDDEFIILDFSIPEVIGKFVPEDQVIEVVDHRVGNEKYWQEKLGNKALITKIGSVATIIFERWGELWDYGEMSPRIAKLLLAAILDNTLNFNAGITTDRDHISAAKLAELLDTTVEDFADWYFSTTSKTLTDDLAASLVGDTKPFSIPRLGLEVLFGQITVWNSQEVVAQKELISQAMSEKSKDWLVSILDISKKQNRILTNNHEVGKYLLRLLSASENHDWLVTNHLHLRKEILAKVLEDGQ